jgi:hypothetical protein
MRPQKIFFLRDLWYRFLLQTGSNTSTTSTRHHFYHFITLSPEHLHLSLAAYLVLHSLSPIPTRSRSNPKAIPTQSRSNPNPIPTQSWPDPNPNLTPTRSRPYPDPIPQFFRPRPRPTPDLRTEAEDSVWRYQPTADKSAQPADPEIGSTIDISVNLDGEQNKIFGEYLCAFCMAAVLREIHFSMKDVQFFVFFFSKNR